MQTTFPTWLEINLAAVAQNTRHVCKLAGVPLMAVVKANAYGYGAVEISQTVLAAGARWLAVARVGEGLALRQSGIEAPILVFGMATPSEVDQAIAQNLTLTLPGKEAAELFSARAKELGRSVHVHLKVDTGMGRFGVLAEHVSGLAEYAASLGGIELEGLYSHFAMVDSQPDHPLTGVQMQRFEQALNALEAGGWKLPWVHCSNSAAVFGYRASRFTMMRAGSAMLGIRPFYYLPFPSELSRVISWKAQLASCKQLPAGWGIGYGQDYTTQGDEWIGVIPVGYGDGFRRCKTNEVLVDGLRAPVVGRVCVDLAMIRLPKFYPMGTEVVLLGQQGTEAIYTEDLADRWNTSQADVTANINPRVTRVYISGN
jgi:alanine racemase